MGAPNQWGNHMTIKTLARHGLLCRVEGGKLLVSPTERITPALRDLIRENRQAIVEELSRPLPPAPPAYLVRWGKTTTGQQWVEAELSRHLGLLVELHDPIPPGAGLPGSACPAEASTGGGTVTQTLSQRALLAG